MTEYGSEVRIDGHVIHAFPRPQTLLEAGHDALRERKLSARKAEYVLGIAEMRASGATSTTTTLAPIERRRSDSSALSGIRGVGRWTAQWTLMRALGRVDALPAGDLALQRVVGDHYFGGKRLTEQELEDFAEERWKPWRGLAVTYLFSRIRQDRVARESAKRDA